MSIVYEGYPTIRTESLEALRLTNHQGPTQEAVYSRKYQW